MLAPMVFAPLDLRRMSLASHPVARALALSLLLHLLVFVTIELGHQNGWWRTTLLFSKRQAQLDEQAARMRAAARQQPEPEHEVPLMFVEVDPTQATEEAPKDAKYYSALNSRAANPDPRTETEVPKIDGRQERVPQTMDRTRPEAQPLQPAPKPPEAKEPAPEPEPAPPQPKPAPPQEPKPETGPRRGDLAMSRPAEKPKEDSQEKAAEAVKPTPRPPRPRTLEAARRQKGSVAGEKMRQSGGVKRLSLEPSFDVRATPFGAYDSLIIAAIQKHWYDLLDAHDVTGSYSGKVVVEFRLNSDGSVTDMKVSESSVTDTLSLLCQRAVQDPAPFAKWPPDLRRLVGKEYREVRFTFYYN
jgi:protein TonB